MIIEDINQSQFIGYIPTIVSFAIRLIMIVFLIKDFKMRILNLQELLVLRLFSYL